MANKIKVKLILELHAAGMSRNMIAATRHISKLSVSDVIRRAGELSVTLNDITEKSDEDVYRLFYPDRHAVETLYKDPGYDYVHEELKKTGVTLKLLWDEYRTACAVGGGLAMGYTKYCKGYTQHTIKKNLTNHLLHKPALQLKWIGRAKKWNTPAKIRARPSKSACLLVRCRTANIRMWNVALIKRRELGSGAMFACLSILEGPR